MENIFLVDDEFDSVCTQYAKKTQEIEEQLQKYLENIKAIVSEKALEGESAQALLGFAEVVEQTTNKQVEEIGLRYKVIVSSFIENISTSDDTEL